MQTFDGRNLKTPAGFAFAPTAPDFAEQPGNHVITLSGDATGSGANAIAVTVVGIQGYTVPTLGAMAGNLRWTGTSWILDTSAYLSSITSAMVTTALGFTPLNATAEAADSAKLGGQLPSYYAYTLPVASASALGGVKPDGTSILNSSGVLSATAASVGALPVGGTAADSSKLGGTLAASYALQSWVTTQLGSYLTTTAAAATYQPIPTEGTWTPAATNLSGSGIAYFAKWIKVGNLVFCTVRITGTGLASTAASTSLTGPTFTAARNSVIGACAASIVGAVSSVYSSGGTVYLPTIASTTEINLSWVIFLS